MYNSLKSFVKVAIPERLLSYVRKPHSKIRTLITNYRLGQRMRYFGTSHYCSVCKSYVREFLPFGLKQRTNALCPVCGSLERHRLITLFFERESDLFLPPKKRFLHIAPDPGLTHILQKNRVLDYVSADLAPEAMLQMDLTNISFPDETFHVIFASHVLEHIEEDRKAMREIARVLKTGGWAVLQVPITTEVTFENHKVVHPKERELLFGQSDHVRRYGIDYYDRLSEAGFKVKRKKLSIQQNQATVRRLGLQASEEIALCLKR